MAATGRAFRAIALAALIVVGLAAHAGSYLMAFPAAGSVSTAGVENAATLSVGTAGVATDAGSADLAGLAYASHGSHAVGLRRLGDDAAPVAISVWYPAVGEDGGHLSLRSSYALNALAADVPLTLATSLGTARLGARADVAGGPYPLVVLSAGYAIAPESYAWLAEHLASHGMVVVAPHYAEMLDPASLWRAAIARPQDVAATRRYVEREVGAGGRFERLVDPTRVAVVGHSLGGYTALAAAGASVDAQGFAADCARARRGEASIVFLCDALESHLEDVAGAASSQAPVDAVVSLAGDAAMFGPAGLASVTAPLLVMGGTEDHDSPFAWTTALAYEHAGSARRVEVSLEGAGHFVFAGECAHARRALQILPTGFCEEPAADRARAHAVIRHYVTAFLLSELTESPQTPAAPYGSPSPAGVGVRSTHPRTGSTHLGARPAYRRR